MAFWALAAILAIGSLGLVSWPLLRGAAGGARRASHDMQVYRDQLGEVDAERARGVLTAEEAEASRVEISRRLLASAEAEEAEVAARSAPRWFSRRMAPGLALAGALAALGLYGMIGADGMPDRPLEGRTAPVPARPGQAEAEAMMAELGPPPAELDPGDVELIERLREALAERPDDAEGHRLLAGSLGVMGRFAEARAAQSRVVEIRGENASAEELIDLAELMILAAGGYVSPEAEAVLRRALLLAPGSPVARYYSGLTLLQAGRADLAYPIWSRLLEEGPSGAPWVAAIAPEIGEVARLAGRPVPEVPVPKGPGAADLEAAEALSPEDRSAMIEGMVAQLGARLAEQGGPPEEWAQLIRSLGVLGRTEEARAIWQEAQSSFADAPAAMAGIDAAARSAGLTP